MFIFVLFGAFPGSEGHVLLGTVFSAKEERRFQPGRHISPEMCQDGVNLTETGKI